MVKIGKRVFNEGMRTDIDPVYETEKIQHTCTWQDKQVDFSAKSRFSLDIKVQERIAVSIFILVL